jgi:hypothetical protein
MCNHSRVRPTWSRLGGGPVWCIMARQVGLVHHGAPSPVWWTMELQVGVVMHDMT